MWHIALLGKHISPHGPAALMTASGLKRDTTAAMAFTQRGGPGLFTTSAPWPWPSWFCVWGLSGKPQGSTRMRCDTLHKGIRRHQSQEFAKSSHSGCKCNFSFTMFCLSDLFIRQYGEYTKYWHLIFSQSCVHYVCFSKNIALKQH